MLKADGHYVYVEMHGGNSNMQQLLTRLSVSPFTVRKVERKTASLEEIFMKVAKRE